MRSARSLILVLIFSKRSARSGRFVSACLPSLFSSRAFMRSSRIFWRSAMRSARSLNAVRTSASTGAQSFSCSGDSFSAVLAMASLPSSRRWRVSGLIRPQPPWSNVLAIATPVGIATAAARAAIAPRDNFIIDLLLWTLAGNARGECHFRRRHAEERGNLRLPSHALLKFGHGGPGADPPQLSATPQFFPNQSAARTESPFARHSIVR